MSVLDDLKKLEASIVKRYRELQPAIAEIEELRRVAERLGVDLDTAAPGRSGRNGGAATRRTPAPRRRQASAAGQRRRRSNRRDQMVKLVNERPGITVPEIGKELKVDPTGLYRIVRQLEADGAISKKDKGLHPAAG